MKFDPRKIKRTKRELLMELENLNKENIIKIMEVLNNLHMGLNEFQLDVQAFKNALIRRGIINEFDIIQERKSIDEMRKMESQAIILGKEKGDG